ncbi:hypothetical protein N8Z28_01080, partial [bacterium]|nr:hypothetical protein [bacterium]
MNYWSIKNKIPKNSLTINLRIYRADGTIYICSVVKKIMNNNVISIRKLIIEDKFEGMLEVEIISTENIKFPFPAI